MSATRVTYTWNPDPVVFRDAILTVAEALRDPRLPLIAAKEYAQQDIRRSFETETSPDGEPWQEWSRGEDPRSSYDGYYPYAEQYPNIGILRQDEDLFDAAISDDAFIVSNDTLFYEADLPSVGAGHQEGIPRRKTKQGTPNPLAARPFLGLSDPARTIIFATFADWFDRSIDLYVTVTGRLGRRHTMRDPLGRFMTRSSPMPRLLR